MLYMIAGLTAFVAYLIGSINTSIILSRNLAGDDIRNSGSGNAGATNMLRTHGKGMAAATLICDILKGVFAVVCATWLDIFLAHMTKTNPPTHFERIYILDNLKYIAAVFVVLGHDFPLYFGFRGGKGVATSLGAIIVLDWRIGLIVLAFAIMIMIASRYVSLGAVMAAAVYPFLVLTVMVANAEIDITYLATSVILALILVLKHSTNIRRLREGTESKLFARKETQETDGENDAGIGEDYGEEEE